MYISYELKKLNFEPAIIEKTTNLPTNNLKKNTQPRWVDTWARDTVSWYWSADTLLWQLSIDHNINVQSVCNISFPVFPN